MSRQIWLSPILGNNRSRLIERCATLVSQGEAQSFLYLAASHPLLEIVTEGLLDGARNRGVWGELPVYLFRGFVRHILSSAMEEEACAPLSPRIPIDREELPLKRALISQILKRLVAKGQLNAMKPLANREGCVNTIATLMGEIQRAAKTPAELREIVNARAEDYGEQGGHPGPPLHNISLQIDFDREVALIYAAYCDALQRNNLTEADADQLRSLSVLQGEVEGRAVTIPWLADVRLLVLDGFFDFTPVQGEMLRRLIPQVPEVIVNLNYDERNPEIFRPFEETIKQLSAMGEFEIKHNDERAETAGALAQLRTRLFNPEPSSVPSVSLSSVSSMLKSAGGILNTEDTEDKDTEDTEKTIRYFECSDRETEIRTIAKEIKRLVIEAGLRLDEIALVVRERTSYAETITRVMREESLACNLERRLGASDIPGSRAVLKLLAILEELAREPETALKLPALAGLIKSGYFRLADDDLASLTGHFDRQFIPLLRDGKEETGREERLRQGLGIGRWDADALENVIAYVGSELRVSDWLKRSQRLINELPGAAATRELLNIDASVEADADEADQIENAEIAVTTDKDAEKKRRPSRDVHPAAIAWTALVIEHLATRINEVPRAGAPAALRLALMKLFSQFEFYEQVRKPARRAGEDAELPRALLDLQALELLRRAFVAAIKAIEITSEPRPVGVAGEPTAPTNLAIFIDELRRSLNMQTQVGGGAARRGLRVLEATDMRGLRFGAVFIAGLVEGGFPLRASRDWIYPHEERERLKKHGLTLEDISPATLLKEEHYFYQAACRATERLYLTRPLALEDDSETVASYYIDELKRAIAPAEIMTETMRRDLEGKHLRSVSNRRELAVALVRQQERSLAGQTRDVLPLTRINQLLGLARNDGHVSDSALRRIEIERERAGRGFGPYDGQITDPDLLALLQKRFGSSFPFSASGLSTFGNCPYRFFAQRVLKLDPRGEAALDLQAIDAGKLLHDILRRFFEQHRRDRLYERDRDALLNELRKIADKAFDEHERVVPPLNRRIWEIDREIRKILLDQVLLYELAIQEASSGQGVVPAYFELGFGGQTGAIDPASTDRPLELTRATFVGEETMTINGQIDRVDIAADDTLIAYDYKLSKGATKDDITSGRSLQIPLYLEALEHLIFSEQPIAGGGYYVIRGGSERRNKGLYRASYSDYTKLSARNSVFGDHEWQQIRREVLAKIWSFFDQMRTGEFLVTPSEGKKTCRFCDYSAVCRYERHRIEGKS